jgi:hypothetical protein
LFARVITNVAQELSFFDVLETFAFENPIGINEKHLPSGGVLPLRGHLNVRWPNTQGSIADGTRLSAAQFLLDRGLKADVDIMVSLLPGIAELVLHRAWVIVPLIRKVNGARGKHRARRVVISDVLFAGCAMPRGSSLNIEWDEDTSWDQADSLAIFSAQCAFGHHRSWF